MGSARYFRNDARKRRILFIVLWFSLCVIASLEAQEKARRPSKYACPVTANLFPKQERSDDVLRYIFPDITMLARRMSIALVSSDGKDVEIAFKWTDWRPHPGTFIVRADGSPNCYFLGPSDEFPENIMFVEISLTIPPGVEVKEVLFSSLGGEYVSRECPWPALEKELKEAFEEIRLNPQDEAKSTRFIALLEKARLVYDCVPIEGGDPIPAIGLADLEEVLTWMQYLYYKVDETNEFALRVFADFYDILDGAVSEMMADRIWKVLHDRPMFILENWASIRDHKRNILGSGWLQSPESNAEMIEIYRDIARKEPKYKSACDEIISILSEKGQAD